MGLAGRSVDSGTGINVLVDNGATGDMQIQKLGVSSLGSQTLIPADATNGLLVDVSRVIPGTGATALGKAEDSAHTSGDTGVFILGVQSLARTARSVDGDYTPIAVDAAGAAFAAVVPEANSAWACTNYSALAATSGVIKASPGKLFGVTVTNDNAAARYIQFFNLTAVPANGVAPDFVIKLGIGAVIQLDFGMMGKYYSTGICWCNSTTGATKTLGSADTYVEARYL